MSGELQIHSILILCQVNDTFVLCDKNIEFSVFHLIIGIRADLCTSGPCPFSYVFPFHLSSGEKEI